MKVKIFFFFFIFLLLTLSICSVFSLHFFSSFLSDLHCCNGVFLIVSIALFYAAAVVAGCWLIFSLLFFFAVSNVFMF